MNDRIVNLLEQYDIELLRTRKGRGALLCDTNDGCLIFKEYTENPEKVILQNTILKKLKASIEFPVEQIICTKEGSFLAEDVDGKQYILKTFFEGRECNNNDINECGEAAKNLAYLHKGMIFYEDKLNKEKTDEINPERVNQIQSLQKEFEKHNRELKKVYRYLKKKSQKSSFENTLLHHYDYFEKQAMDASEEWSLYQKDSDFEGIDGFTMYCHGDYQYHNIIHEGKQLAIVNFERIITDSPTRDLCLFLRKLMEKNNWSFVLGEAVLDAYNSIRPLSAKEFIQLYYRLYYPEKFWKIVNFYYNNNKAWIPEKNSEKLRTLYAKEVEKQAFLDYTFRNVHV